MFPYEHIIPIKKESKIPVYRQIAISITTAVRNGTLKAGTHLPGSRELARILGVHRKTVIAGYEELYRQDWITVVPRKYVKVAENIPVLKPRKWNDTEIKSPYENKFNGPFRVIDKDIVDDKAISAADMIINDGHPDVRLSPIDSLLRTYRSLTSRKYTIRNANIGTAQGSLSLREEMAAYLSVTRGLNISAANLLITHGAQMSIYLSAQLLLHPETSIIVGRPNYPVANATFEEAGASVIGVAVDDKGIDTNAIEEICKRRKVDAIYVIPHHHYPTTVTLSAERRVKLLELSQQFSFTIIEDDYDYDYHYTTSPYLPLASGNHHGNVIYIGSFSKMLDPALRIGFMVAPKNFIDQCTAFRKMVDVGGDGYMQHALATLIKEGELNRHLKKAKKCYHQRRDFLDALLKKTLSRYVSYTLPTGGMAIWIKLNPGFSVTRLVSSTRLEITRWDENENAFRFGFASMNEDELKQAVDLLKAGLQRSKR